MISLEEVYRYDNEVN